MTEYTDKTQQIVHEAEITRQHARYKIPAVIEIEGERYKVSDWSVSGVGIINLPDEIYKKNHITGKMIFKFDDFETVIDNLNIEFITKKPDGVTGARFTELTPQQISILNQIISAYLAGDIITEDDIIHAVTRANFIKKKEDKVKVDTKKSILVLIVLWSFIIFLILFLFYVMYQRIYIVKSENAYFDVNMTIIRAPSPSYIEFARNFKQNEEINVSEPLMYAHIMYGGVKTVHSPLKGIMYKVLIHNGDFRNVGEPVFAVLERNYRIYIVANILHKDLVKVKLGDIAKVSLPNGDTFYAKVVNIKFPYNVVEEHAKPLENIYNQARNYDKVILEPINYIPSLKLIGTSAVVTIDTFLNKHKWYHIKESGNIIYNNVTVNNDKNITVKNSENKNKTDNSMAVINNMPQKIKSAPKESSKTSADKSANKYCIIAASSQKPFTDEKAKKFLSRYERAEAVKEGSLYEIKLSYFKTYKKARLYMDKVVRPYYKDAFIIKCKTAGND